MSKTCDYTLVWKNTFHRPGVVPIPGHDGRFRCIYKNSSKKATDVLASVVVHHEPILTNIHK